MTTNLKALSLAVGIFRLQMQNEQTPDFSECLARAIGLQCGEKPPQFNHDGMMIWDGQEKCSCGLHERGESTAGWWCPVHGQVF